MPSPINHTADTLPGWVPPAHCRRRLDRRVIRVNVALALFFGVVFLLTCV